MKLIPLSVVATLALGGLAATAQERDSDGDVVSTLDPLINFEVVVKHGTDGRVYTPVPSVGKAPSQAVTKTVAHTGAMADGATPGPRDLRAAQGTTDGLRVNPIAFGLD